MPTLPDAKQVDVAIIGAGTAGLSALAEVRKVTNDYLLIDDGPLGTTCARSGCMPSKMLIQIANQYHGRRGLQARGIHGGKQLRLEVSEALAYVRGIRDGFAGGVVRSTRRLGAHLVRGRAVLAGPNELRVGKKTYFAKHVILATGSRPIVPPAFRALGSRVVTTESLFELEDLPPRIGVIGLGSVGLELGQALSRLGRDVIAFDRSRGVGGLTDPAINAYASRHFAKEFRVHFNTEVTLRTHSSKVVLTAKGRSCSRDLILASLGRRLNLDFMGLEAIGAPRDGQGLPDFDPATMKLRGLPIYLAGDASAQRPVLHEASDDGRIAGYNSVHPKPRSFKRRVPLAVTFSAPNLAMVGRGYNELKRGSFVTGEASFETDARSVILGEDHGLLHVYARTTDGKFLGAEMIGPAGEHLAHLMAWALQQELTVFEMLRMPFYHPVVEEGLRTALRDAVRRLKPKVERREIEFSEPHP